MTNENTKELILDKSMELFAKNGFAAVSMRDISDAVGIKASSIYYHFESKQALFDAMIERADDLTGNLRSIFTDALGKIDKVEKEMFVLAGVHFLKGYLMNKKILPLLKILECERFHSKEADKIWKKMLFDAPMEHETKTFEELMKRGLIHKSDASQLAFEYQAIINMGYFTGNAGAIEKTLGDFYDRVFKGGE